MMEDKNMVSSFKNVIDDIVDARINKIGISKYISAIVKQVNANGTVNIALIPDENKIIHNLLNKTGEPLQVDDSVELCTKNGNISNAWVALKHGTNVTGGGGGGTGEGDMLKSVYDPNNRQVDAFNMTNMVEGSNNKIFTLAERTKLTNIESGAQVNVKSDWNATSGYSQILNKPTIPTQISQLTNDSNFVSDIAYVHTDNNYTTTEKNKLSGIATGAEVNVQSDWSQSNTSSDDYIKNKPTLSTVATSGSYNDLSNKPTIPTQLSQLSDDSTHRLVTDTEKSAWNNKQNALVSGTNIKTINSVSLLGSGNFDLVPTLRTVNGKALSSNITLTTADITDSTDKRYVTDTQLTNIGTIGNKATKLVISQNTIPRRNAAGTGEPDSYITFTDINSPNTIVKRDAAGNIKVADPIEMLDAVTKKYTDFALMNKQNTLISGTNIKTINGNSLLGAGDITISGGGGGLQLTEVTVSTAYGTAAKVGTTSSGNYVPALNDILKVNFSAGCNVANPTLNIDGSGAKNIRLGNANVSTSFIGTTSALTVMMWYDGTYYQIYGSLKNDNTTYSEISDAETIATTSSTARLISGRRLEYYKNNALIIDEDDMVSNLATKMPSQQSVKAYVDNGLLTKQDSLVSATNIKTINGASILGSGNIVTPDTNTTYSEISEAEIDAGTSSTLRTITGRRIKYVLDKLNSGGDSISIGTIKIWFSNTVEDGWLLCDGSTFDQAVYPELYAFLGNSNVLPNLKGRVPVGKDTTQTEFDTIGKTGGHKLLQSHNHDYSTYITMTPEGGIDKLITYGRPAGASSYSGQVNATGGGNAQNLQPYQVVNYVIKAKIVQGVLPQDANVIDTLDSTSPTNALSSNMGRVLKDLINDKNVAQFFYNNVTTNGALYSYVFPAPTASFATGSRITCNVATKEIQVTGSAVLKINVKMDFKTGTYNYDNDIGIRIIDVNPDTGAPRTQYLQYKSTTTTLSYNIPNLIWETNGNSKISVFKYTGATTDKLYTTAFNNFLNVEVIK